MNYARVLRVNRVVRAVLKAPDSSNTARATRNWSTYITTLAPAAALAQHEQQGVTTDKCSSRAPLTRQQLTASSSCLGGGEGEEEGEKRGRKGYL